VPDRPLSVAEQVARISAKNLALLARLEESERRFRRISRGVLKMQEEERGRLSRDLHDGVGQLLTALKIQLELLAKEAERTSPELAPRLLAACEVAERGLHDVRRLSRVLRPAMLDELGIVPTLKWLTRTFQEQTGIAVRFACDGEERRLDPDVETLLYRLVQEALTNAAKHAGAPAASVRLILESDRVVLRVEDEGAGFDPAPFLADDGDERGFGLRSMRDRVAFLGGRFEVRSAAGVGTSIEAELALGGGEEGT
jgi:two-component system, NarL family, sensor kinase